jgi:hypothetical protein
MIVVVNLTVYREEDRRRRRPLVFSVELWKGKGM